MNGAAVTTSADAMCFGVTGDHTQLAPEALIHDGTVELVGGKLMAAERQSATHYTAIQKTARVLALAFGPGWEVRTQGPIGLGHGSEPVPDVAVVPGSPDDYRTHHPSRPTLTVEVAESSLEVDRVTKGSLYARAGLAEYWVLNLADRVLEVYQKPAADPAAPFGWRYLHCEVLDRAARVTPVTLASTSIAVAALLP